MTFMPTGTVYGVLLNFQAEVEQMAAQMSQPPYKAPPKAPVLYIKTANTWSASGSAVAVPANVPQVEVGATVGMVIGADGDVVGFALMNDLSIPHASFFRPPVKFKCLDGFLGVGPALRDAEEVDDPATFHLTVEINGQTCQSIDFAHLVRSASQLLAEVGAFMTLAQGDVLMLGCDAGRPLARAGDSIRISAPGFEPLSQTLTGEPA
ncbi:MAG: fumarylacetoacetate hydrolase family protein [Gammaproteobacteria bacterium]|nr:fumarylacetoacetate hydrolase family protein [Gammaproteobacteria bacterium]